MQSPLLGFNNNVRHKGRLFHIQTEDSGVRHPHVITHLFMLTGASARTKLAWICAGWLAGASHLAAPWLARYGGAALAVPLYVGSGLALAVTTIGLVGYPLLAMWRGAPAGDG